MIALAAERDRLAEHVARLREERAAAQERATSARQFADAGDRLLIRDDLTSLHLVPGRPPVDDVTLDASLAELCPRRDALAAITADVEKLTQAPIPLDEAFQRLDRFLDSEAGECAAWLGYFTNAEVKPPMGEDFLPYKFFTLLPGLPPVRDLLREQLRAHYAGLSAPIPRTNSAGLAELRARRLKLEREEEALILAAEAHGLPVYRRSAANPWVVLSVQLADRGS